MLSDVDTKTLTNASRRYARLRRTYWQCYLGGVALLIVLGTPLFAFDKRLSPVVFGMLAVPMFIGFLACMAGGLIAWSSMMRFRCPRCGERFLLSRSSSWPTAACKHCSLSLGMPDDPAK